MKADEKASLLKAIGDNRKGIVGDENMMAIGIEFRLNVGCERHALPQL